MRVTTITPPQSSIEDMLCSRTRLKILKFLMKSEMLTASETAVSVGVNSLNGQGAREGLLLLKNSFQFGMSWNRPTNKPRIIAE